MDNWVVVNPTLYQRSQLKSTRHGMRYQLMRLIAVTFLILGISSCSLLRTVGLLPKPVEIKLPPAAEIPYIVMLTIDVHKDVNPDLDGRPSPVKIKIFLTEPTIDFKEIEYNDFFGLDSQNLEPSAIMTISLRPGTTQIVELNAMKSQNQLTIAAAFRRPNQTKWLDSVLIGTEDQVEITAAITNIAVVFDSE